MRFVACFCLLCHAVLHPHRDSFRIGTVTETVTNKSPGHSKSLSNL